MSRWGYCFTCAIFVHITAGLSYPPHQSVYVPNYFQAQDESNGEEISSQEEFEDSFDRSLDYVERTTGMPGRKEFISEASTIRLPTTAKSFYDSTVMQKVIDNTVATVQLENNTHASDNMSMPWLRNETSSFNDLFVNETVLSTESEHHHFDYREPTPPHGQLNRTTDTSSMDNSTTSADRQNQSRSSHDLTNQTQWQGKNLIDQKSSAGDNRLTDDTARYLSDQKAMQSLVHLLPPNLWTQFQQNMSANSRNQTQFIKNGLPDPVLLAEAAAQAGLSSSGGYSFPQNLWSYDASQLKLKLTATSSSTTRMPLQTKPTRTTPRTVPYVPIRPEASMPNSNGNNNNVYSLFSQIGFNCPSGATGMRFPDRRLCNMYFTCTQSGLPEPSLCPEGYLFSDMSRDCETASRVTCGSRLSGLSESDESRGAPTTSTTTTTQAVNPWQPIINSANGTIECTMGLDGYFEDPLFCNVYHHCIAGTDYIEHCPNQLAWNEKKKMCDWATNVNCTGKTMPVQQSTTSFCTNRQDGRYSSDTYCNVFHHCSGGTDHIVRCTGELQWDDKKKECGWKSAVRCGAPKKMLPSENKVEITYCTGKADGSYSHEEYCNVYYVCESGSTQMRQCPHQLFWDNEQQKCEWSNNVHCSGRTLVALSMESNMFCMEKSDGFYIDTQYCNVYHQCMADIDVKLRCPERLVYNETLNRCDWPESSHCKGGSILLEDEEKTGFCADKSNGNFAHEQYCNRYYICQNGKDVVFTCQNNLRYSIEKNECDWAVNVECQGKADYMWEGIKENFCKRLPDGNYPDGRYCNMFHQCQAAMDYPKRCPNRLMFKEDTKECDWEDQVDCKGREKLIDTEGLEDAMRPGTNNTRGRSTKFCMTRENGDYADLYYCNVYHNCHGGFDTIQYCTHGLVWRQESETVGRCDWSRERSPEGTDCAGKVLFFAEKLAEPDILSNLRSEFCMSKGPGLYEHQQYCDLYVQCNEQGVGVTMECSPGLVFNEKKKECDYQWDSKDDSIGAICIKPRSFLRAKPKAEQGSILFEGVDATGSFPTRFDCSTINQQNMLADLDWCNIYHVCVGSRDNIFLCPPGTIFNDTKQGCMDRFDGTNCNGTRSYFKPSMKRLKRLDALPKRNMLRNVRSVEVLPTDLKQLILKKKQQQQKRIPTGWKPSRPSRQVGDQVSSNSSKSFFSSQINRYSFNGRKEHP